MMEFGPLIIGLVSTFFLTAGLLCRYGQPGRHHVAVTASVFFAWYFSMLIIILMPLDVSSTAYRQCLVYHNISTVSPHEAHGPRAAALTSLRAYAGPPVSFGDNQTVVNPSEASALERAHDVTASVLPPPNDSSSTTRGSGHLGASVVSSAVPPLVSSQTPSVVPPANATDEPHSSPSSPTETSPTPHPVSPSTPTATPPSPPPPSPPPPPQPIEESCVSPWSHVPGKAFPVLWRIVYWSSQLLTWIILPMMQSYSTAGDFTTSGKLKTALYENAMYYGTYLCIFVVLLLYLIIHGIGLDSGKLKVLLITASNTWGLFLLVLLLGSGLVELPRSMWNWSRKGYTLRYLYFKAAKLSMEKCETEEKLDYAIEELRQVNTCVTVGSPLRRYVDVIISRVPRDRWDDNRRNRTTASGASVSESSLVRLHKQVIKAMQGVTRTQVQWDQLLADILYWEDVTKNEASVERRFKSSLDYRPRGQLTKIICTPTVEWYWRCLARAVLLRALAVVFAGFTVVLMFSEVTFFIRHPMVSIVGIIHRSLEASHSYFGLEVFSAAILGYLCLCTYYTLFKIRIFNLYYLVPHQQTSEYSLIFSGMMLCRLTPPLCLNFLGMTHLDQHISLESDRVETAYTHIMGHMDVISIVSDGFNVYFPMLICVLGIATYLKWGSKIVHALGFEQFLADDEVTTDLVDEGRDLVKREKNRRQRQEENEMRRRQRMQSAPSQEFSPARNPGLGAGPRSRPQIPNSASAESARAELLSGLADTPDYNSRDPFSPTDAGWPATPRAPPRNLFDDV